MCHFLCVLDLLALAHCYRCWSCLFDYELFFLHLFFRDSELICRFIFSHCLHCRCGTIRFEVSRLHLFISQGTHGDCWRRVTRLYSLSNESPMRLCKCYVCFVYWNQAIVLFVILIINCIVPNARTIVFCDRSQHGTMQLNLVRSIIFSSIFTCSHNVFS